MTLDYPVPYTVSDFWGLQRAGQGQLRRLPAEMTLVRHFTSGQRIHCRQALDTRQIQHRRLQLTLRRDLALIEGQPGLTADLTLVQ